MEQNRELSSKEEKINNIELKLKKRIRLQIFVLVVTVFVVIVLIFAMTAAWFTNVAKTSDLVFKTESWGFDAEKIQLSETAIPIAPGKSGIVPLTIDNSDGTESVEIGITISKTSVDSEMDEELQKRIFFYVEAQGTDDEEEISQRVYLATSAPHNYVYTILPGQRLLMDEMYYNDLPLRWEWVYDMLGYYFRGTIDAEAEENKVHIDEYVRPIEYDFEKAVFDVEEASPTYQQLLRVGTESTEEFLEDISSTDGYEGTIDIEETVTVDNKVYYPVEVDEHGYGMWAYLCTLDEIKAGIEYDTGLANSEEEITATATIILTAHNIPAKIESVSTEADFEAALLDENVDVIELNTDILSGKVIGFNSGKKVINLNGYTMQYTGLEPQFNFITVSDGATLTVTNGQVQGESISTTAASVKTAAFELKDGNLLLNDVMVSGFDCSVYVEDNKAENAGDSTVQITHCNLKADQYALILQGNGAATGNITKAIVYDSVLTSKYNVAITGQGNDDRWGTELMLAKSEISGYYAGIYQPQKSSVTTISQCKISGNTGIAVKGGTVHIYESEIRGTGEVATDKAAAAGSGFVDTGDAVYVEAVYNWPVTVYLKDENTIVSDKAYAVELFGQEDKGPGKIVIYDGTFNGQQGSAAWNGYGFFEIFDGTFNDTVSDLITRYDVTTE